MEIHLWKGVCVVCALLLNATGRLKKKVLIQIFAFKSQETFP